MRYRRSFAPGGTFFFTVVTAQRRPIFANPPAVELLRASLRAVRTLHPFLIDAMVVLPDHLHCIWTLPPGDADFATRWRLIKTWFVKHQGPHHEKTVWQRRYWGHLLRDENDFEKHTDYIHYNLVRHGLVMSALDWPWSSFHRYVRAGIYTEDWGGSAIDIGKSGRE